VRPERGGKGGEERRKDGGVCNERDDERIGIQLEFPMEVFNEP